MTKIKMNEWQTNLFKVKKIDRTINEKDNAFWKAKKMIFPINKKAQA